MTSWNIIPDADIDAESPITESLMFRLRDNTIAVNENDVSVPYANLQLIEGMRTSLGAGKGYISDGTKVVDGGFIVANTMASLRNGAAVLGYMELPIDAGGVYMVHVHATPSTIAQGNRIGKCHVNVNAITNQSTLTLNADGVADETAFSIVGSNIRWTKPFASTIENSSQIYAIRVS